MSVGRSTGLVWRPPARALVEADGGRLELSRTRPAVFTIFLPRRALTTWSAHCGR